MKHVTVTMTFTVPDDTGRDTLDEIVAENLPLMESCSSPIINEGGARIGLSVVEIRPVLLRPLTAAEEAARATLENYSGGRTASSVARVLGHEHPSDAARVLDRLVELGVADTGSSPSGRRRWWLA